jgi:predicted esterase
MAFLLRLLLVDESLLSNCRRLEGCYPNLMERMMLRLAHRAMEARDEASPTGFVEIESGASRAVLLTPSVVEPGRRYPLFTVFHGAGRQDEMLVKACREEPDRRQALFLVPRSVEPTWDLIAGASAQPDLDFLEYAWDLIYRRYPIDPGRQALIGYSDGASYALSLALSNPGFFDAALCWAAGFAMMDRKAVGADDKRTRFYLEYGTADPLFPFEQTALPMRENLEKAGYRVEFSVDEGGRHWPSGSFQREALDWYFETDA